jgi:hypothetical protein
MQLQKNGALSPPPAPLPKYALALLLVAAGCLGCPSRSDCALGTSGCACTSAQGCDPGLSCQAGTCVPPGGPDPSNVTPGADALVRFCHNTGTEPAGVSAELQVGSQRLSAAVGQCAPAPGQSCVAVRSGKVPVSLKFTGAATDFGVRALQPGKAYLFTLDSHKRGNQTIAIPRAVELESAADCNRLDFKEAELRTDAPLALEPFATGGYTFAKPRGFVRKGNEPHVYAFEHPSPGDSYVSAFKMTYFGRLPWGQTVPAVDFVNAELAARKLTVVEPATGIPYYAAGVGDTGVPGPGRYVLLMYHRHWDLEEEGAAQQQGYSGEAYDVFMAEIAFSDLAAMDALDLRYVLKSIAWGVSVPADPLPKAELAGTWVSLGVHRRGFSVKLEANDVYEMKTSYVYPCVMPTPVTICPTAVVQNTTTRGRYLADGGVLVLHPSRCELQRKEDDKLTFTGPCPRWGIPTTLRMERAADGNLRFGGLGFGVQIADKQNLWVTQRSGGPPGNWTVPTTPPARPNYGGTFNPSTNVCGAVDEVEPNDSEAQANLVPLGQDFSACMPAQLERDWFEVRAPSGGAPGYFVGTLKDVGVGKEKVKVRVSGHALGDDSQRAFGLPDTPTTTPGETLYFAWPAIPGQRFLFKVETTVYGWFKYAFHVTFTEVKDPTAPNHSYETARPLTLGSPVQSYIFGAKINPSSLFAGAEDYYTVRLAAGPVTVRIDNVPSNLYATARLTDISDGFTVAKTGRDTEVNGQPVTLSGSAFAAGDYRLFVTGLPVPWWYASKQGEVPESFTKPYRLVITQP